MVFQDFSSPIRLHNDQQKLVSLRDKMKQKKIDGWLISRTDEFQGEYLAPYAERLAWLTGFTGSAGQGAVSYDKAAIFIDGRYTTQVKDQIDLELFEDHHMSASPLHEWIIAHFEDGSQVGYDHAIWTKAQIDRLTTQLKGTGILLKAMDDLIDEIWEDQPSRPVNFAFLHDISHAGLSAEEKITQVQEKMKELGADLHYICECDALCWLLNIRGSDIAHNPIVQAHAIIPQNDKVILMIDKEKLPDVVRQALEKIVDIQPFDAFKTSPKGTYFSMLEGLFLDYNSILLDPMVTSQLVYNLFSQTDSEMHIIEKPSPITLMKAIKNKVEIAGHKKAQSYDASAMTAFLDWFDLEAPKGQLTEISTAKKLENFREETGALKEISFDTISGFAANGAIIHYRVTEATDKTIQGDGLYLVDSGGQYDCGTTDITRTIVVGTPSLEQIKAYTLVLKGHIALAQAIFPKGTTGAQLDVLARMALWQHGLDFDHGTGHGIGSYLNVHEGPQSISKRASIALEPGMLLSNEPGYYKPGAYGIRLENILLVVEKHIEGAERDMLGFETTSFVRFDKRLIDENLLIQDELDWLDSYHAKC